VSIKPLRFNTGKRHPLASRQKFEVVVSGAAAHNLSNAEVIGDFVLYSVGPPMFNPTTNKDSICGLYLIAWKEGWTSEVRLSHILKMLSKTKMNDFFWLASNLRTRCLRPNPIRVVGRNNPVGSIARTGARAVSTIERRRP
jgi:hypothetical protein